MEIHLLRTVPLALPTREAWATAGVYVVPRKKIENYFGKAHYWLDPEVILINLGWRKVIEYPKDRIWNTRDAIKAVSRPLELRETLGQYLPPPPEEGDGFWIKNHGFAGKGKVFVHPHDGMTAPTGLKGDVQKHINGTEYRVNTVGPYVIQAHVKHGNVVDGFDWEWVGVQGIKNNGIIPMLKEAIVHVPDYETTVFGWDVIVCEETGKPYVLEVNTSAGVNEATAKRIVNHIQEHYSHQPTSVS